MQIEFNPATLFHEDHWIVRAYYEVRYFFKHRLGKSHMSVTKEAFCGHPWDEGYLLDLEYAKIKEMRDWVKKKGRHDDVDIVVREMNLCLSLLDIVRGKKETFHFDGKLLSEPVEGEEGVYRIVESPDFKYVCDVKVNTRNIDRFVKDEKVKEYYLKHLGDLYELKARYLYHKIRAYKEEGWWC